LVISFKVGSLGKVSISGMQILLFGTAEQPKDMKARFLIQVMQQMILNCPREFLGVSCQKTGVKVPSPTKIMPYSTPGNPLKR
jgi:hypothetical protein